jgi:hypothetical protein
MFAWYSVSCMWSFLLPWMERVHLNESLYICLPTKRVTRETFLQRFARSLEKTLWQDVCINVLCVLTILFLLCVFCVWLCVSRFRRFSLLQHGKLTSKSSKKSTQKSRGCVENKIPGVMRRYQNIPEVEINKHVTRQQNWRGSASRWGYAVKLWFVSEFEPAFLKSDMYF